MQFADPAQALAKISEALGHFYQSANQPPSLILGLMFVAAKWRLGEHREAFAKQQDP